MEIIACKYCGNTDKEYLVQIKDQIHCKCCNVAYTSTAHTNYELLLDKLEQEKLEKHLIALKNLYNAICEKYQNSQTILNYASIVKSNDSENMLANLYEILINQNHRLSSYLNEIIDKLTDSEKEFVAKQVIINLDARDFSVINIFIDSIKDMKCKEKLFSELEVEIEKLDAGIYSCQLPRDVFIAHSSKDNKIAIELVERLEEQGFSCFISSRNLRHGVNASSEYITNLKVAIENCSYFLMINSVNSRNAGCDVIKIELPTINEIDRHNAPYEYRSEKPNLIPIKYKKKRINYLIDDYCYKNGKIIPFDNAVKEFFDGYEYCNSIEKIEKLLIEFRLNCFVVDEQHDADYKINNLLKKAKFEIKFSDFDEAFKTLDKIAELDIENAELWILRLLLETQSTSLQELADKSIDCSRSSNYLKAFQLGNEEQKRILSDAIKKAKENFLRTQKSPNKIYELPPTELSIPEDEKIELINQIKIGNTRNLKFGKYQWRVLSRQKDKVLLISEQIIKILPYHDETRTITWEHCTLRNYLNNEFLNEFNKLEQNLILDQVNITQSNPWHNIKSANNTVDKFFLLSVEEVVQYFGDSGQLDNVYIGRKRLLSDQFDTNRIAYFDDLPQWWWLRTSGSNNDLAISVNHEGNIYMQGCDVNLGDAYLTNHFTGVRPAMWVSLKTKSLVKEQLAGAKLTEQRAMDRIREKLIKRKKLDKVEIKCKNCGGNLLLENNQLQCDSCHQITVMSIIENIKLGKTRDLKFGEYKWRVLALKEDRALLITESIIGTRAFSSQSKKICWENSDIRHHLNNEIYKKTFTDFERSRILITHNVNHSNEWYPHEDENMTDDKIFLLSVDEVIKYFGDSNQLTNRPNKNVTEISDNYKNNRRIYYGDRPYSWLLRTRGSDLSFITYVDIEGHIKMFGDLIHYLYGIRPALWISLKDN